LTALLAERVPLPLSLPTGGSVREPDGDGDVLKPLTMVIAGGGMSIALLEEPDTADKSVSMYKGSAGQSGFGLSSSKMKGAILLTVSRRLRTGNLSVVRCSPTPSNLNEYLIVLSQEDGGAMERGSWPGYITLVDFIDGRALSLGLNFGALPRRPRQRGW
jgi:hypothetical protein